ncbi:pectate lyase [Rhizoctonia solani]|uniref:Pectate lyase n=1 Tax=Rhizoctonia solani TaxID=456999 RepID=A0A8H8P1Z5_9AGAM|nr:pectate lyase [Rhizoctonia solani]QRW23645.1 pectate lyase [Rhizoctonia solani]
MFNIGSLTFVLFTAQSVLAVGSPFGFATGTTGGAGAAQAIPTSAAQLKSWLEDNVTRNILLDRTYDFTDTESLELDASLGVARLTRNSRSTPQATGAGLILRQATVTYKKAGTSGIRVKSTRPFWEKAPPGGSKERVYYLIIITALEPLSRSLSQTTTLMVKPPGRGTSGYSLTVHMYNNYFNDITGHAIDADVGTKLLAEGNYFNNVRTPSTGNTKGAVFAPTSSSMNSQCSGTISRNCVSNTLAGSGSLSNTANTGAIGAFTASVVKSASVMDPASVPSFVLANAGLGKVN